MTSADSAPSDGDAPPDGSGASGGPDGVGAAGMPHATAQVTRRSRRELSLRRHAVARRAAPAPRPPARWSRKRGTLATFAGFAAVAFAAAWVGPTGAALTRASAEEVPPISLYASTLGDVQAVMTADDGEPSGPSLDRSGYTVYVTPTPTPTPTPTEEEEEASSVSSDSGGGWRPPFVTPDPGSAQAIAYDMVLARGWGDDQFSCLVALWNKESGWRVNAYNASSGAYGIPQSLPGNKMASAGADWETNPATQISWGLGYIAGRYGTPCGAWDHSTRVGWY